jgi:predicted Zn-dependent protease
LFLSLDQLCRIAIISASDIQTYIEYATTKTADDPLAQLRKAQMMILMGYRSEAKNILVDLAGKNPEIYSAYRLLEVIAIHEGQAARAGGIK